MSTPDANSDLFRPAGMVARHDAGRLMEKVDQACHCLAGAEHPEALHDFRVALRRLRTYSTAYRDQLPFRGGDRRRLRKLARATNSARDTEVMLATIETYQVRHPRLGPGLAELIKTLTEARNRHYDHILAKLPQRWGRLSLRLWQRLEPVAQIDLGEANFVEASAAVYRTDLDRLHTQARRCTEAWSLLHAHRLRIAIKRLRYLLEGLTPRLAAAGGPLGGLRNAQDRLGELHDLHVMGEQLPTYLGDAASQRVAQELGRVQRPNAATPRADTIRRRDPLPAQLALYHHLLRQFRQREQWIRDSYLTHDLPQLIEGLEAVAVALSVHQ